MLFAPTSLRPTHAPPTPEPLDQRSLSPSLLTTDSAARRAFEVKFLLTEPTARAVQERAAQTLRFDDHADPLSGGYQTTTLYCDTPNFDLFHRKGMQRRRKHRLRRYGVEPLVFLECKTKKGQRVRKRRTRITAEELTRLAQQSMTNAWQGDWFQRRLLKRQLQPVCRITYDRIALTGTAETGPIRLTFDRNLRGCPESLWDLTPVQGESSLLGEQVICEFKFQISLPIVFKTLIEELCLTPASVSKYRRFLRTTDLAGREGTA